MNLETIDLVVIGLYLAAVVFIGFYVNKLATRGRESYYLAGRNIPWWMLGLSGCSSYIDIGGTMAMVGALYYLGLKSVWMTHIFWGWFIICFYMAFQAKWIRRSGVMTFAEWNETRFGKTRDAEAARLSAAIFLLVLMIFNLMFIAVGIGKFAEEFFPFLERWMSVLIVFSVIGVYVTLAGFFGVILTDMLQTLLIGVGAVIMAVMVFNSPGTEGIFDSMPEGWRSMNISWTLWEGFKDTPDSYQHFYFFGPVMLAGFTWMIFRVLAGPNVWDFQFFLTARSTRDAALAGGMWTVGYVLRWILGCAFLVLGIAWLGAEVGFDAEKIMPKVLSELPPGVRGLFLAVLLAALMSTLDAMINVTSSVVVNDFLKRYLTRELSEKRLVLLGQIASIVALMLGFFFSMAFKDVVSIWETMIFVVVTMILVPATLRWHWWRFSAKAFVCSMAVTTLVIILQKIFFSSWSAALTLAVDTLASLVVSLCFGWIFKPTDTDVLVRFYASIRPFGVWGPIRREAVSRGLVPADDKMPMIDALNGVLTMVFQFALALVPFYGLLRQWKAMAIWLSVVAVLGVVLYATWYKNLPAREEG